MRARTMKTMVMGALVALGMQGMATAEAHALESTAQVQQAGPTELYRQGRRQLNAGDYREAARTFRTLRSEYREAPQVADSYYWEAFALNRTGSVRDLERALELLEAQGEEHPQAATPALRVQIEGALARRGDAEAVRDITIRARSERDGEVSNRACDSEQQELRAMALNALLNMNSEQARPLLREVLESRDPCSVELRRRAVFLVSQTLDEDAVDILLELAHRNPDPDPEVREQAVFWLSQVGSGEAARALVDILRSSDDPKLQESAIYALAQHGGEEAWTVLRDYAERTDAPAGLRERAIYWLGQNPEGSQYLRGLYDRVDDPALRRNIIFGVAHNGSESDWDWLLERALDESEDIEVRKNALFWAGQMGMEIDRLGELYDSVEDHEMKEQVIFVLSQSRDKEDAVTHLMTIARSEEDSELRQNALYWLGQMDDPRIADFLLEILRSGGGRAR